MLNVLAVFIGGGIGSVLRYVISLMYLRWFNFNFPLATLSVNIIGAFLLGALLMFLHGNQNVSEHSRLALTVGLCGGLTTFSTFSFEVFDMLRRGEIWIALIYIMLSVLVTVIAATIGFYWAKAYVM